MKIGYARTSTLDQQASFEAQIRDLEQAGAEKVFREQISSVGQRTQLDAALDYIRDGDTLLVTRLDRLARSVEHLVQITGTIARKGASLHILQMDLDTGTPTGKLMVNLLGSIAQFERELMLERQREGIARAKAEGKYQGRVPTARRQANKVVELRGQGIKPEEIGHRLGISRASVFRILKDARDRAAAE